MGQRFDQLLTAHHIKPWDACDQFEKMAPDNGLLLNALHGKAFEGGLITIRDDLTVAVSPAVPKDGAYADHLWRYDGCRLRATKRSRPRREFIEYHNNVVFKGAGAR